MLGAASGKAEESYYSDFYGVLGDGRGMVVELALYCM